MELVEIALPTRLVVGATRVFPLLHSHTELGRGLEPAEEVVILDCDGEYHAGVVEDIDFTLDDTVYVLRTGVRLPEEHALARLRRYDGSAQRAVAATGEAGARVDPHDADTRGGVDDVVDLIGEMLRRQRREPPV